MAEADFIAGRPGAMTGYRAGGISLGGQSPTLRTQMEEGNLLGQANDALARQLNAFVGTANQGLDTYTNTARTSGQDYLNSDETSGAGFRAIGNSPVGG